MPTSLIILLIVVIVLAVIAQVILPKLKQTTAKGSKDDEPGIPAVDCYEKKRYLLSPAEYSYYKVLHQILPPDRIVLVKVRLADLFDVRSGLNSSDRQKALNRITSKHLDFVICHRATCIPEMAIELDDRSHQRADRQTRDLFVDGVCRTASLRLVRQQAKRGYALDEVRSALGYDSQVESEVG